MDFVSRTACFILAGAASSFAYAYDAGGPWTTVNSMYIQSGSGPTFVYFEAGGLPGCYGDNGAYISPNDAEGAKRMYAALLSAQATQQSVKAYYNFTGSDQSEWSRCMLEAVYMRKQ